MDEEEGLRLKMEVYKANGSHTLVQGLLWVLDMAPEGPWQNKELFHFTVFQQKIHIFRCFFLSAILYLYLHS